MRVPVVAISLVLLHGCGGSDAPAPWQVVGRNLTSALVSVWGTSPDNVFAVGGDAGDGMGPVVEHWNGTTWERLATGQVGNLWWVYGFDGGPVYMGGDGGMVLRFQNNTFTRLTTPGIDTVFGIWGATPDDVWAVGGAIGAASGGFAWRLQGGGDTFVLAPGFPTEVSTDSSVWKMYGRSANDAWMVGTNGLAIRWDGSALTPFHTGTGDLFTVSADAQRFVAVGGSGSATILENTEGTTWTPATSPPNASGLIGVCLVADAGFAVGQLGGVLSRSDDGWKQEQLELAIDESLHSVWIDPSDGVWVVGGSLMALPLTDGIMLYRGSLDLSGGLQ